MAWNSWSGFGAFEEEASGACLERSVEVFVGVERGDHHDGDRIDDSWSSEQASGFDAVESPARMML